MPKITEEQLPLIESLVSGPDTLMKGSDSEGAKIPWQRLSPLRQRAVIEALLYAADRPISMAHMREVLGATRKEINPILQTIRAECLKPERGLHLVKIAGGYAFRTKPELSEWLRPLLMARPPRLSRAALETLAIIAYRQPVTRAEVEEVRGVDCGGVVRSLLDKRLIRILGRRSDVGRPMIYGTSREFLETFGLKDLSALPPLAEIRELKQENPPQENALEGADSEGEAGDGQEHPPGDGAEAPAAELTPPAAEITHPEAEITHPEGNPPEGDGDLAPMAGDGADSEPADEGEGIEDGPVAPDSAPEAGAVDKARGDGESSPS